MFYCQNIPQTKKHPCHSSHAVKNQQKTAFFFFIESLKVLLMVQVYQISYDVSEAQAASWAAHCKVGDA